MIGSRKWAGWTGKLGKTALCLAAAALWLGPVSPAQTPQADSSAPKTEKRITPAEAKKLFSMVDELLAFSSQETGLPIHAPVKRQLTTREAIEKYLNEKLSEDQSAKRLQQSELVLKKFGLLDRDFSLRPFLTALLKEQIEAYYDDKTKTVNLLDWVSIEEQKPVMAHELTHALQDQTVDLEKWSSQTPLDVSTDASADNAHLAKDEMDTARDAIAEGQATAVMMNYALKPLGKSLEKNPEVMELLQQHMSAGDDSPVMARAPLLLSESMLFPYREGLSFEQDIWMDKGQHAAFAGMLDRPPSSSWEILNPREYEQGHLPPVPLLPNIHPLLDPLYKPYDIGQIGQLDLHILTKLLGGDQAAKSLTSAWDGGLYWAGQLRSAQTAAERASTASLGFFYLSVWKNEASARSFARLYGDNLARKYEHVENPKEIENSTDRAVLYATGEGPVLITTRGKMVFVAESFPLEVGQKLTRLILDAQGSGALQMAQQNAPRRIQEEAALRQPLTAGLVRLFSQYGVPKVVVRAQLRAAGRRP